MKERSEVLEMFKILRGIKKRENFKLALMSKEQLVEYIVEQMEFVEDNIPEMVVYFDDEPTGSDSNDNDPFDDIQNR